MKTWHIEMAGVAVALLATWMLTGAHLLELVGSAAVLASFAHTQVSDRLAQQEALRAAESALLARHTVRCWRWLRRYLVSKELLWATYFIVHQSWSALVGVGVFLIYPAWRHWRWRAEEKARITESVAAQFPFPEKFAARVGEKLGEPKCPRCGLPQSVCDEQNNLPDPSP